MKIPEIQTALTERHHSFCQFITGLNKEEFLFSNQGKWTAGQQLDHIRRAVSLLPLGLRLPKIVRVVLFGSPGETSMSYDELVKKYRGVLARGGKASGVFIPKAVTFEDAARIADSIQSTIAEVNNRLSGYSELQLDSSRLPHPLLGKITLREMMLFTIYHVEHHHLLAKGNLQLLPL